MGLKELLRYESGLTIIPLTNRWSHNEDCGLKEGGAMFFAPGDAREMSCFELRELAVLASGTKGQKRILATFEVDSDSLESGKAKINRTTGNLWHSYTDEYEQEEIYLPYYNKDTVKLIFVDKDFDKTAQYADELISYYSYSDEWYDEDYGEYMSHFEEGTPDGNIDFPYKNRIAHMERAMENKRGIDLWDTESDGSYYDVLYENKEPFEEHVRMMTRALYYDIDACNRRFHKDTNELEWVWHPSVASLIHGANGGESDYEVLFDALEEYGENKMETVENTWESIRESPYLTDNEKTYYEQHSDTYDNASSLKKDCDFLSRNYTRALRGDEDTGTMLFYSILVHTLDKILGNDWENKYGTPDKEIEDYRKRYKTVKIFQQVFTPQTPYKYGLDNDVLMGISHARYLGISDNEIVKIFKEGLKDGITPQSVNQTLRTMLLTPGQLEKFAEYDINPKEYEYRQLCELKKLVNSGVSKDTLSEIADPDNPADKMEKMGKLALYEQNTLNEQNDIGQKSDLEYTMTFAGNDISDDHGDI